MRKPIIKNIIRKSPHMVRLQKHILLIKQKKYVYSSRLKLAWKLSQNSIFRNCLRKYKNVACLFTAQKYRELMKEYITRRKFTEDEKHMAVFLYKRGPKAYKWLSIIFCFPSAKTIKMILSNSEISPGLNENLFQQLEQRAGKLTVKGKLCVMLFDEICITSNKNSKRPDHALIFMLQGIAYKYKLPLTYTFSNGPTSTENLKEIIKEVISRLQKCGFNILAIVCNHRTRNEKVLKELALETRLNTHQEPILKNSFEVNGKEIVPIYDPAYLMKATRNNFMRMDIEALGIFDINTVNIAKWQHVVYLDETAPKSPRKKLMPNITKKHVHPTKITKRKVKFAIHIFSRSVASLMKFLFAETSDVLFFYDQLFDSMNGNFFEAKEKSDKILLRPVTMKSYHNRFWGKAKTILESTKFITKEGRKVKVPSVAFWLRNLEHTKYLQTKLHMQYRVKSFWMRRFTLHAMEELIDYLISHGYRKIKPTPSRFKEVFTSLVYNGQYSKMKSNTDWTVKTPKIYSEDDYDDEYLCSVI